MRPAPDSPSPAAGAAPDPVAPFRPMPRDRLRGVERVSVSLLERINRSPRLKAGVHAVIGRLDSWFIRFITGRLWEVHGLEHTRVEAPRGVIMVSNHRSFFDMYLTCSMLHFESGLTKRLFFPVRSGFFYDRLLGTLLNLAISGGSMWPPVFRDEARRDLNRLGLEQLAAVLGPGALVGIHPEGRRGTGPDPYELLPVKAGLGRLIAVCHPDVMVLPYFTLGSGNRFVQEVRRNFRPPGRRGEPVRMRFGAPLRAGALQALGDPMAMTEAVMDVVRALGEEDRRARAADPRQA